MDINDIKITQNLALLSEDNLKKLWESVGWTDSIKDPKRLLQAMYNASNVWIGYDDNEYDIVALLSAIDDGYNAYITYLLVDKEYQGQNLGSCLIEKFKERYNNYFCTVITNKAAKFYEKHGFTEYNHSLFREMDLK